MTTTDVRPVRRLELSMRAGALSLAAMALIGFALVATAVDRPAISVVLGVVFGLCWSAAMVFWHRRKGHGIEGDDLAGILTITRSQLPVPEPVGRTILVAVGIAVPSFGVLMGLFLTFFPDQLHLIAGSALGGVVLLGVEWLALRRYQRSHQGEVWVESKFAWTSSQAKATRRYLVTDDGPSTPTGST